MRKRKWSNNLIWIVVLVFFLYIIVSNYVVLAPIDWVYSFIRPSLSPAVAFISEYYGYTVSAIITLAAACWPVKKNRFILRSFLPKGMGKDHPILVVEDRYEPTQENTGRNLLIGLLLGFLTNFFCVVCALLHGDIHLYLDFSWRLVPTLVYALLMVFIQSSSEELWCRGFMYERICIRYPLWVAVLVNGLFFGLLHVLNPGATFLGIADIVACGISYTLLRWYTGSIWMAMGVHTMWNFTQNFLFGLPNSGLVSQVSVFHMDAMNGVSNLIYDYDFGVEGGLPGVLIDSLLGVVCLLLAARAGRLGELTQSYEKKAAQAEKAEKAEPPTPPEHPAPPTA